MSRERREKFITLAERRTNNAIKQIRLIGNLSNKGNYDYSTEDVEKIFNTLNKELKAMKDRFSSEGGGKLPTFKL